MKELELFGLVPYAGAIILLLWALVCVYVVSTANRHYKDGYKTGYKDKEQNKKSQY